jgi:hypothetical protein
MKKLAVLALALTAATALAAPVLAGADDGGRGAHRAGDWIGVDRIHQQLTDLGYTGIREIERDDGGYEVDAISPDGRRVDLRLQRDSGKIVRIGRDDDDDDDDRYDD